MELTDYLEEFAADWRLAGRAPTTANIYVAYLEQLDDETGGEISLAAVKRWLAGACSPETARMRARAVRAFGRWAATADGPDWSWWKSVPLASVPVLPQETVDQATYKRAVRAMTKPRDRLVVELLWCTGCRVSELARLHGDDVSYDTKSAVVRTSKTGQPRMVPLSAAAIKLIRRHGGQGDELLLGMTANAIQALMKRHGLPSPHAWRRGWAVRALREGVSQVSVQAAAGWTNGAMVGRYTNAVSSELALAEFARVIK